jgi:hypothetical protein
MDDILKETAARALLTKTRWWRSKMSEVINPNRHRSRAAASPGADHSGGNMDEILKRLGLLEVSVAEIRGTMPHLATKADLNLLRAEMNSMEARLIKWMIGAFVAVGGLAYSVAKFVH